MAVYKDLLDAIARVRASTGDPAAWMQGLSADEIAMVSSPITINSPGLIDAVLAKIEPPRGGGGEPAPPDTGGDAARAINIAETSLAQQNSVAAQLDLQVVSAILNAHATNAAGSGALEDLQREVESAVVGRANLDTPAGARELQRYLTGLLREITTVVQSSSLDATSKAALAAALASLYRGTAPAEDQSTIPDDPSPRPPATEDVDPASPIGFAMDSAGSDPLLDELFAPDTGAALADAPRTSPAFPTSIPQVPALPGLGGSLPGLGGLGSAPSSGIPLGGLGLPAGGLPIPDPAVHPAMKGDPLPGPDGSAGEDDVAANGNDPDADTADDDKADVDVDAGDGNDERSDRAVELPTGEVITAPSPELAKVISAAVSGTPIAEAFQHQGITLPAPGSAVADLLEPKGLQPGDIGVLADRHALALGNGRALLNNQIQPVENIAGPGFLGWEHPPGPGTVTPSDDHSPAPTRPAVTVAPSE